MADGLEDFDSLGADDIMDPATWGDISKSMNKAIKDGFAKASKSGAPLFNKLFTALKDKD